MLQSLTRRELLIVAERFGLKAGDITDDSIRSYISNNFGERSIRDMLKYLKKVGQITTDVFGTANAAALGQKITPDEMSKIQQAMAKAMSSASEVWGEAKPKVIPPWQADFALQVLNRKRSESNFQPKSEEDDNDFVRRQEVIDLETAIKKDMDKRDADLTLRSDKLQAGFDQLDTDFEKLQATVEELASRPGTPGQVSQVVINLPELAQPRKLDNMVTHAAFNKVLRLVHAGLNVVLVGPAGSGKTTLASHIAQALGVPYYFQSLTAGTPESALTVRLLPLGVGGAMRCVASPFACGFAGLRNAMGGDHLVEILDDDSQAGVTLLDEVDAMDANTGLVLNSALANGEMTIEALAAVGRPTVLRKHRNNHVIMSANTFGTGMDLQYAGRNALDAAFLDRGYLVQMTYDPVLEAKLFGLLPPKIEPWKPAAPATEGELRELAKWVLKTRERIEAAGVRKVWGTRAGLKALAARRAGIPTEEVKRDLMLGWPADLVAKMMVHDNG